MSNPNVPSPVLEASAAPQETLQASEVTGDSLYDLNKFTDADGNVAFRWQEANQTGEMKTDVSAEADEVCLQTYLAELAISKNTPEEQQKVQDYFANSMRQIIERRGLSDKVSMPMGFINADQKGIGKIDQQRLGALRGVARKMDLTVGPFVWDKKTQQVSFKATEPGERV